jgi:hypothetical protein
MSIVNLSKNMLKMIISHSAGMTIMINTTNPNEIIKKDNRNKRHISHNCSKNSHNKTIVINRNSLTPLKRGVSRK